MIAYLLDKKYTYENFGSLMKTTLSKNKKFNYIKFVHVNIHYYKIIDIETNICEFFTEEKFGVFFITKNKIRKDKLKSLSINYTIR